MVTRSLENQPSMEVLTMDGNKLRRFLGQGIPPNLTIYVALLEAVGTTFNVFVCDSLLGQNSNLSPS